MLDLNLEAAYYDRLRAKDIFQKKKKARFRLSQAASA